MEIEKKFKVKTIPDNLSQYECKIIEQAYLNTDPVIRVRKENEEHFLTYKKKGLLIREEYNLPLDESSYFHMKSKADGNVISKKRYLIPLDISDSSGQPPSDSSTNNESPLVAELDIFDPPFAPLIIAEVEFPDLETANSFIPPDWFGEEITMDMKYRNSNLSVMNLSDINLSINRRNK
ncbi:MAG: CYTH domain-containing protein [Lachnospiraceae bacterium]|nr:CYTH domain-containing protein [Lachnospiraceae bacterium]